jgi:hypothetical protein
VTKSRCHIAGCNQYRESRKSSDAKTEHKINSEKGKNAASDNKSDEEANTTESFTLNDNKKETNNNVAEKKVLRSFDEQGNFNKVLLCLQFFCFFVLEGLYVTLECFLRQ